ncbi:AI-2E family transporter [Taibaiella chishuiensis]|uniref:Putative PurR-regulated permease PerM n=1 Tax=Taibaiella chishuiensis TaxID=1434707 RepID=A0A2P8D864_9BACT|nr:AI-2E family transporter [Taibaiella chishuiensis]PSK93402.1 putative PurR-regulated permease PerM [Taibaiella chishuiensis]
MEESPSMRLPFYLRLTCILISVTLIILLMHEGRTIFIPLFFSVLISFMLLPLTQWLERRRLPRGAAAFISLLLFLLVIAGFLSFMGQQITDFSKDMPELGNRMQVWIQELQQWISKRYHVNYSTQISYLSRAGASIVNYISVVAQSFLLALSGFLIWTVFVFIFTFFILTHRGLLRRFMIALFKERHHTRVNEVMLQTRLLAKGYIAGLLIEMILVALINCTALLIFGVKYAILLGILAAVLNIIPYIGIYSAAALAAIITLSNSTPGDALQVIIILLIIHFIDANILMPRIVGGRVKMNPLITIVAVLTGSMLWGISGTFLFIPLAAILKIIFERVNGLEPWAILMGTDEDKKALKLKSKSRKPPGTDKPEE